MIRAKAIFPGWLAVAAGFLCMMIGAGVGWFVFPVFLKTIESELGWSRTAISGAISLSTIVWGISGPIVGIWVDRYGPRRLMIVGVLLMALATALLSRMTALWHLYALILLSSVGGAAGGYIPITTTISHWFDKRRGRAMSITLLGMSAGGFVMPNVANLWLRLYGWRTAYLVFSFFVLALVVPIYLWMHRRPSDLGLLPDGESPEEVPVEADPESNSPVTFGPSLDIKEAIRTRSFWGLGMGDFFMAISFTSISLHMVAFATDSGISQTSATTAYSLMHGLSSVGLLAFGVAADRSSLRGLLTLGYAVPVVAIPFLLDVSPLWPLYVYVVLVGVSGGGRAAVWPLALGHCFGLRHFGVIMGWLAVVFTIGNAIGPPLAGYVYDTYHSYRLWFIVCIVLATFSPGLICLMRDERGNTGPGQGAS